MKELKTIRDILQALLDGHEVEMKSEHKNTWVIVASMLFDTRHLDDEKELQGKYRIKTTKPSINWDHVSDELKYLAVDEDGQGYLFSNKPTKQNVEYWYAEKSFTVKASWYTSYKVGNCEWYESLVERPKGI